MTPDYARLGFDVVRGAFSAAEVADLRAAFDRVAAMAKALAQALPDDGPPTACMHRGAQFVIARAGLNTRIHRVVWCGAADRTLLDVGADPRLLNLAAEALGHREFDHLINQAHYKLPGDTVQFPWHQDSVHRRYGTPMWTDVDGTGSYVQVAIALDSVAAENGPLAFIPGSHLQGHIPPREDGSLPPDSFDPATAIAPTLSAGDVVLFGPYTIHGSGANTSDRPRRVLINGYASPGANRRVYPGDGAGRRLRVPD